MASENKKRKLKNSHLWRGGLKDKTRLKGIGFYNSAVRQEGKRAANKQINQT